MFNDLINTSLLIIIGLSLFIALVSLIINISYSSKITYYESPRGLIERAYNESYEKEYWNLKNLTTTTYYTGLAGIIICIGGLGVYMNRRRNLEEKQDNLI
ncbi:MAG: hypothetical protein B6U89_00315 [Desulfurococcales archaeon ex4484_58]|nr:MAG: hypothetical protein B6U89_00315 [Desulfurococcales archaeon ex4484_58]